MAMVLVIGLAGCGSGQVASPASDPPAPTPASPAAAPTPHRAAITVVEVVQVPSDEAGRHIFAMLLSGEAGTSAVRRSLEIWAWTEPIEGSSCGMAPVPTVLRPHHADAVQPALADQTRTIAVRSQGNPEGAAGAEPPAKFRYGPVPSLNGGFDGWVSFHLPADSADGFCAFDVQGVVVVVAGETTVAELPVIRIDTRDSAK